jgi:streptogramin lyase
MVRDLGVTNEFLAANVASATKIQQVASDRFLGRNMSAGTGNSQQVQPWYDVQVPDWTTGAHVTNFSTLQYYLSSVAATNSLVPASAVYYENFGSAPGSNGLLGACLAPNGVVYFIAHDSTIGYKINPASNSVGTYSLGPAGFTAGAAKNCGGVLAPNGRIYFIPGAATPSPGYLNPENDVCTTFGNLSLPAGTRKWYGGVLAPNGLIYCAPHNSSQLLIINPNNNTLTTLNNYPGAGTWPGSTSFSGAVLAPNGRIYMMGIGSPIVNLNPNNNTVTTYASNGSYAGGVVAPNGKIYFMPYTATSFLVLDPSDDSRTHFGTCTGSLQYEGGVLAPNGCIYAISLNATIGRIIDPSNNTVTTITGSGFIGSTGYTGAVIAPNNKIYFTPYNATSFLCLNVPANNNFNLNVCTNPFFNKY